jgi:dihydrofolate reductase
MAIELPGMRISLVVAMTRQHVIGRANGLPWRLPEDLKHFKAVTLGKPILMGRRTFDSIGKPLPGRTNLVLTRDTGWKTDGVTVVHSVDEALSRVGDVEEVAGIGGAEVFRLLLPLATRIHLTWVEADVAGDTWFPPLELSQWRETHSRRVQADERNAFDMTFVTLERASAGAP